MATAKTENYSAEETKLMIERYTAIGNGMTDSDFARREAIVKELATELGKKPRSIIGKLSREKVYIPKQPAKSKVTGREAMKKEEIAELLVSTIEKLDSDAAKKIGSDASLQNMNKVPLAAMLSLFEEIVDRVEVAEMALEVAEMAMESVGGEADEADEADEANEVNEADEVNEVNEADEADEADEVK